MATRINMLKLLQEVRGLAQFGTIPHEPRPTNPLLLQFRGPARRKQAGRVKRTLQVSMMETADIPSPVPIKYTTPSAPAAG
jgi:hypothetical protein